MHPWHVPEGCVPLKKSLGTKGEKIEHINWPENEKVCPWRPCRNERLRYLIWCLKLWGRQADNGPDKASLHDHPRTLISSTLPFLVYPFKALKEERDTCINHNYFTHAKISRREEDHGLLHKEKVKGREGELSEGERGTEWERERKGVGERRNEMRWIDKYHSADWT